MCGRGRGAGDIGAGAPRAVPSQVPRTSSIHMTLQLLLLSYV